MLLIDDDANLRFPKLRKGRSRSDEKSIILTCTYICPDFDWLVILSPVIVNLHPYNITPLGVTVSWFEASLGFLFTESRLAGAQ
jgi:hypothetical protein